MKLNRNYLFLLMLSFAGCFDQGVQGDQAKPAPEAPREQPKPQPKPKPKAPPREEPKDNPEPEQEPLKPKKPGDLVPTWEDLKKFLKEDKSGSKPYDLEKHNCTHFSRTLRNAARKKGFEAAYVSLSNVSGGHGHAINAFYTLDYGIIYIEPQHDQVAYVRPWSPFGSVPMNAVKRRYLACPENPNDLIHQLDVAFYEGDIFGYDFYPHYKARVACVDKAHQAFDEELRKYNNGRSRQTFRELDMWNRNLRLLERDIGSVRTTPPDLIVLKITKRWN